MNSSVVSTFSGSTEASLKEADLDDSGLYSRFSHVSSNFLQRGYIPSSL